MSGKNLSAVQILAHSLYAPSRNFSGRTLAAKSFDALNVHQRLSHKRAWPKREETFAALQLMRQNREWSNLTKMASSINQGMTMTRRGITPRRNNIITARNASAKRMAMRKKTKTPVNKSQVQEYTEREDQSDIKENENKANEDRMTVGSIRDVVFGAPDKVEDEREQQLRADEELLNRVSKSRSSNDRTNISKKVIAPYLTYKNHRNCWAEFRHRLVYGGVHYF